MTYRYGETLLHPWLFETLLITQNLVPILLSHCWLIVPAFPSPTWRIHFLSIKLQLQWEHLSRRDLSKCHRLGIHYGLHPDIFSNDRFKQLFLKDNRYYLTRQESILGMHCKHCLAEWGKWSLHIQMTCVISQLRKVYNFPSNPNTLVIQQLLVTVLWYLEYSVQLVCRRKKKT